MLDFIRNRAQTWVVWVIVALIIIPFALWGVNEYFTGESDTGVATVNKYDISKQAYQTAYESQRQRMQDMLGESYDSVSMEPQLKQEVIDNLIDQEVLVQAATKQGFRIGNDQLAVYLKSIEPFQEDGKFDRTKYEQALRAQGQSPAFFESQLRRGMLASQYYSGIVATALVTDQNVDQVLRLRNQQRQIGYLMVPVSRFTSAVQVGDKEVGDYYRANIDKYQLPEQVSLQYVELSQRDLVAGVSVTEQQIKDAYEEQRTNLGGGEERRASHILIAVEMDAPKSDQDAALKKAKAVLESARKGEDFAALARKNSDDPGSAVLGGDLGFFGKGAMVPEFEAAVYKLKKGEISDLVHTDFGYHIIKLDDIKPPRIPTLAEVHDRLLTQLREKEAERVFFEKADKLTTLAYEHAQSLDAVAKELGLAIKQTGLFTRANGEGIAANAKVRTAAFSDQVLKDSYNSDVVSIVEASHVVVVRVKDHKPAAPKPLGEVASVIRTTLLTQGAQEKAKVLANQLLSSLKSGVKPEELASQQKLYWADAGFIGRGETKISPVLVRESFRLPRPVSAPGFAMVPLPNGDVAVVVVSAVKEGDATNAEERKAVAQMLMDVNANSEFSAMVSQLKRDAKIKIRKDAI